MADDWASYDSVAADYGRVSYPNIFRRPAEDLAALLKLRSSSKLLDVGAGTGAVSGAAAKYIGSGGSIVALDLSRAMLRQAVSNTAPQPVIGKLPLLPFRPGAFDVATKILLLFGSKWPNCYIIVACYILQPDAWRVCRGTNDSERTNWVRGYLFSLCFRPGASGG